MGFPDLQGNMYNPVLEYIPPFSIKFKTFNLLHLIQKIIGAIYFNNFRHSLASYFHYIKTSLLLPNICMRSILGLFVMVLHTHYPPLES